MRILVIDAALVGARVGLVEGERVVALRETSAPHGVAGQLPLMVQELLAETGCDLIAATVGPGSFTGIRAALALAHGLGFASGVPVVPVTVGEAIREALPPLRDRRPWVATASRRGHIFLEIDQDCRSVPLDGLARPREPVAVAGDAAIEVTARLAAAGCDVMLTDVRTPPVLAIAAAGRLRAAGLLPPRPAVPLYVDPPEAKLPAGGLRPAPREGIALP